MRVLTATTMFPNPANPTRGISVWRRTMRLAALCDLRVVAPSLDGPVPHCEVVEGIEVVRPRWTRVPKLVFVNGYQFAWRVRGALRKLGGFRPDIVDAHFLYPDGFGAVWVARRLGVPVVVSARGTDVNHLCQHWPFRPFARWVLRNADHLVAVSAALRERMVEAGAAPERVSVIPNGVDTEVFHPADRHAARSALGMGPSEQVLFSAGALIPQKGFDTLLEGLARAHDGDLRLYIAGSGPERERLEALARRLGLERRTRFLGTLPPHDMAPWYQAADLFVFGSWREGCPNVVLEALACGTPVVATRVGGTPELVREGQDGLLFEARSPDAFAQALVEALSRPWDRQAIAQKAASRSWDNVARECLEVFERVLREHKR